MSFDSALATLVQMVAVVGAVLGVAMSQGVMGLIMGRVRVGSRARVGNVLRGLNGRGGRVGMTRAQV